LSWDNQLQPFSNKEGNIPHEQEVYGQGIITRTTSMGSVRITLPFNENITSMVNNSAIKVNLRCGNEISFVPIPAFTLYHNSAVIMAAINGIPRYIKTSWLSPP
jgi:hypothetical protein